MEHSLPPFPPPVDFQTVPILQQQLAAATALAELKGIAASLPNPTILLNTLLLQEARASSEIENIVTSQDEIFRVDLELDTSSVEAKEVARYREAMKLGYEAWKENHFISENMLIKMFRRLKQRSDGYRTLPGTKLFNATTKEVVYTPPQDGREIITLMQQLAAFINAEPHNDIPPLVKMALIHHQFESIHPFVDGNGRIGRILNVLYLVHVGLLDTPILYLSRAINRTKPEYYRLLQAVRDEGAWQEWVVYMLAAVAETAGETIKIVTGIRDLMAEYKHRLRDGLPKIYSQDLLNSLFHYPYTRIDYVERDLTVGWQTARKYLKALARHGFVSELKAGRSNYYVNLPLVDLLVNVSAEEGQGD